jgi:intracellular sulfur oxidation DsrE/DsrF family protein
MNPLTRRSFVSQAAAGLAALGVAAETPQHAQAQLVWKASDWKFADFNTIVNDPASVKQVYDIGIIGGGKFLNNIKNSLNGLRFGFDVPKEQMKIVAALHGPANMINYNDSMWSKYKLGEWLEVNDSASGKPAERNIFNASKHPIDAAAYDKSPDDPDSIYQEASVQALQARGVQFLSCHTALEEQARVLIKRNQLTQGPEEVVKDLMANKLPGVLVVASMVAAIALLQAHGHYTYITV